MSWQMRGVALFTRVAFKPRMATREAGHKRVREPKGPTAPPRKVAERCEVEAREVGGFPVHVVRRPSGAPVRGTVVYLHGGAYISEIAPQHWTLVAEVAEAVGCEVWVPLYGLAPDHDALEGIAFVEKVLAEAAAAGPFWVMGDSAGGGLALAAAQSSVAGGATPPAGLTLIAPWLDIAIRNPEVPAVEQRDPWLSAAGLHVAADAWRGELGVDDPRVSPLFSDLSRVPPIDLYVGTRDITLPDCRLLRDGVPPGRLRHHEVDGALHVYPLLPVPEAKIARRSMIDQIRGGLG